MLMQYLHFAGDIAEVNAIINVFKDSLEIKRNGTKARNLKPTPHKTRNFNEIIFHQFTWCNYNIKYQLTIVFYFFSH